LTGLTYPPFYVSHQQKPIHPFVFPRFTSKIPRGLPVDRVFFAEPGETVIPQPKTLFPPLLTCGIFSNTLRSEISLHLVKLSPPLFFYLRSPPLLFPLFLVPLKSMSLSCSPPYLASLFSIIRYEFPVYPPRCLKTFRFFIFRLLSRCVFLNGSPSPNIF